MAVALAWGAAAGPWAPAARAEDETVVDRIVAVVNNEIILLSELRERMAPYMEKMASMSYDDQRLREMTFKIRQDLLEQMIDQMLTDQEIRRLGIRVEDQQVDAAVERIKEVNLYTDEQLREVLNRQGLSYEQYRERIREQLLRTELVNREVKSKIVITADEINAYYEAHPEIYGGGGRRYHLRNIIMKVPSEPGAEEAVAERMSAVHEALEGGADFAEMAREHSESLAEEGGDLGAFELDSLSSRLREVVADLPVGGFSGVIRTEMGHQIFYLEDIIETGGKPLDQVREEIQEKLYQEVVNERFAEWLEDLRGRSHIRKAL